MGLERRVSCLNEALAAVWLWQAVCEPWGGGRGLMSDSRGISRQIVGTAFLRTASLL